ncbi:Mak10-domain-containing protein [Polychaeton citri CBS 116435]|uniref:Mak10-domain-containing protein n=1 Tax=Polychaeton citri CBS 116435 TaxID=1314669 RepID=A0A9P4PZ09_9PEZI|nr:Mak10-domain-containing protein [Polychaeton citri CBS 116435]
MRHDELADDAASKLNIDERTDAVPTNEDAATRLRYELKHSFSHVSTKDITGSFIAASKELRPGQLVKDEYFPLFDAVSALEIMDPKMDSGYIPPDDQGSDEFDVAASMSAEEAVWLIDQLICQEMAWHEGHPLSQTLFRSLHIDRLLSPENRYPYTFFEDQKDQKRTDLNDGESITHKVVRAYCLSLVKAMECVLELMQTQSWYDEEDFVPHLFGRDLLPRVTIDDARYYVEEALQYLATNTLAEDTRMALEHRLVMRKNMLNNFVDFIPRERKPKWQEVIGDFARVKERHSLGKPIEAAFSDSVQRRLATSAPPRPSVSLSWEFACGKWSKFFDDNESIGDLTGFWIRQSPHCLKRAVWVFSERHAHAYTRALMQFVLLDGGLISGDVQHIDLLLTDIRDLVLAGSDIADPSSFQIEVPTDPRHRTSRILEDFMDKAFDEYLMLYRSVCQNRCRTRRLLTQAMSVWEGLEKEAFDADQKLSKISPQPVLPDSDGAPTSLAPLSFWTRSHKLQVIESCIQLGFELDIYFPDELGQMYCYLCSIVEQRIVILEHLERFVRFRMMQNTSAGNTMYVSQTLASEDWIRSLLVTARASGMLAASSSRLWRLLVALKVIEPPLRPYATPQLWFEARMKTYLTTSDAPPMDGFSNARRVDEPVQESFYFIEEANKEVKSDLQQLKQMKPDHLKCIGTYEQWKVEVKQLETTLVAMNVQVHLLKRLCDRHGIKQSIGRESLKGLVDITVPEVGRRYHKWWVVPLLKEKP